VAHQQTKTCKFEGPAVWMDLKKDSV